MIYHYSSSADKKCGIALFADKINNPLNGRLISSPIQDIEKNSMLLLEYEYGLHQLIDFNWVINFPGKKILLMHAIAIGQKYHNFNAYIFKIFDHIVFLSTSCRNIAASNYAEFFHKMVIIPHYSEELFTEDIYKHEDVPVYGVHGFAFPRNGFMQILHKMAYGNLDGNLFLMCAINDFSPTAERETSTYINKIQRFIIDHRLQERVTLDFNYYETKEQVVTILARKCTALLHLTLPTPDYYNASGSIQTLLATLLPVFAFNSIFTQDIPKKVIIPINTIEDINISRRYNEFDSYETIKYLNSISISQFTEKIISLIN